MKRSTPTLAQWLLHYLGRLPIPRKKGLFSRLPPFRDESNREFRIRFSHVNYSGTLAQYIDRHIFYFGSYSPAELSFLAAASSALRKSRGLITFIDVGANVGQHSLFMSGHADRVLAFEPNGAVAERLQANIELNKLTNIELIQCALGAEDGEGQLGSGFASNSGSRSLTWTLDAATNITVPVLNAEKVLRERGVTRVDILKIDVEGFERQVFEGLRGILEVDRPVILFELIGKQTKGGFRTEDELRGILYSGSELFTLEDASAPRLLPFSWDAEQVVCLPPDLQKELL
jgi:FkbM family methyltransferase